MKAKKIIIKASDQISMSYLAKILDVQYKNLRENLNRQIDTSSNNIVVNQKRTQKGNFEQFEYHLQLINSAPLDAKNCEILTLLLNSYHAALIRSTLYNGIKIRQAISFFIPQIPVGLFENFINNILDTTCFPTQFPDNIKPTKNLIYKVNMEHLITQIDFTSLNDMHAPYLAYHKSIKLFAPTCYPLSTTIKVFFALIKFGSKKVMDANFKHDYCVEIVEKNKRHEVYYSREKPHLYTSYNYYLKYFIDYKTMSQYIFINADFLCLTKSRILIKANCKMPLKILEELLIEKIENHNLNEVTLARNGFSGQCIQKIQQSIHVMNDTSNENTEEFQRKNMKISPALEKKCSSSYVFNKVELACKFSQDDVLEARAEAEAYLLEKVQKNDPYLKRLKKAIICGVSFSVNNGKIDYSTGRIEKDFNGDNLSFESKGPIYRRPCKWFASYAKRFYTDSTKQSKSRPPFISG